MDKELLYYHIKISYSNYQTQYVIPVQIDTASKLMNSDRYEQYTQNYINFNTTLKLNVATTMP